MAVTINASTSTGLVQSADTSGIIQLQSNGTTALTVNTNEGIQILNCLGVGNATPSTSGAGITFPATQSASTDANTLDDYEEGTWTPAVISGYTSPGYGTQVGRYTKIGRVCYFTIWLTVTSGTRTGSLLQITLPFTSGSVGFGGGAYWSYASGAVVNSTTTNLPTLYIGGSTDRMNFYFSDGNNFNGTNLSLANPDFYITGWMECA